MYIEEEDPEILTPVHIAAIATTPDNRVTTPDNTALQGLNNSIEHSRRLDNRSTTRNNGLIRENVKKIYGHYCTYPQPNRPASFSSVLTLGLPWRSKEKF